MSENLAGVPETGSVQEVLIWQTCTVRMMYRIIGTALRDAGSEDHPLDYLAFFCLGTLSLQEDRSQTCQSAIVCKMHANLPSHDMRVS